jgi:DNA repair exonuclease SbcCD ATPase subunit
MRDVDNSLAKQKEEFSMKMESLAQRREELARKEIQLKDSLLKFDKFLQENDAKRLRAIKKAIEERKMKDQKELEMQELKNAQARFATKKDEQFEEIETSRVSVDG